LYQFEFDLKMSFW